MPSSNLIVKDLTDQFLKCRKRSKPNFGNSGYVAPIEDSNTLLINDHMSAETQFTRKNPALALPPVWVDTLDEINANIKKIDRHVKELKLQYKEANSVTFNDAKERQSKQKIEILTNEITNLFRKSQNSVKRISSIGNEEGTLPYQERLVRLNVMRGKAAELQSLFKKFKHMQKSHLNSMNDKSTFLTEGDDDEFMTFERKGFTDAQVAQIQEMQQDQDQRSEQIMSIVKSVEELAQVFNELQILIVQQGTVLDRIDYNVEQTLVKLESAKKHLVSAESYQKKSMSTLCIFGLLMLIFLAAIILIAKNAGK